MMLSDPELESLLRRAAPREIPLQMRESLARLIPPYGGPPHPPAWSAGVLVSVVLSALMIGAGLMCDRRSADRPLPDDNGSVMNTAVPGQEEQAPAPPEHELPGDIDTPPGSHRGDLLLHGAGRIVKPEAFDSEVGHTPRPDPAAGTDTGLAGC